MDFTRTKFFNMHELANFLFSCLSANVLNNKRNVFIKEDAPVWAHTLLASMKQDLFELWLGLATIVEAEEGQDLAEVCCNIEADVYISELLDWLAADTDRCQDIDKAVKEDGWNGITQTISYAQIKHRTYILEELWGILENSDRISITIEDFSDALHIKLEEFGYAGDKLILSESFVAEMYATQTLEETYETLYCLMGEK